MKMPSSCLPPLLCVLLPLHFAGAEALPYFRPNITLMFDSITHSDSLRKCSCREMVRHCNEALANLLCSCSTVSRSSLTPGSLQWDISQTGSVLTVWVREPWVLRELLNGSQVPELHLSLCAPVLHLEPVQYLTLVGLKRLQVSISTKGAIQRDQALNISSRTGLDVQDSGLRVTLLDVRALTGDRDLKSYSVVGPPLQMLKQHFPNLALPGDEMPSSNLEQMQKPSLVTFVY